MHHVVLKFDQWVEWFFMCFSLLKTPSADHTTVRWLNSTLSLAPTLESSEVRKSKVNVMKKKCCKCRRREVQNMGTSDDTGALHKHPKRAPSFMSSSVIANVLTLMLCCITMCDTRGQINSTWLNEIMSHRWHHCTVISKIPEKETKSDLGLMIWIVYVRRRRQQNAAFWLSTFFMMQGWIRCQRPCDQSVGVAGWGPLISKLKSLDPRS